MNTKFSNRYLTAKGEERAFISFTQLKTLWFNTGTLCNLKCEHCYIESSPTNDRFEYLTLDDILPYFKEISKHKWPVKRIGFTGGEPFLNPHFFKILKTTLEQNYPVLVLTNGYRVIFKKQDLLLDLKEKYGKQLSIRISLDHYTKEVHEKERGTGTFEATLKAIQWLYEHDFSISLAGRSLTHENSKEISQKYEALLLKYGIDMKLSKENLVIFSEMDLKKDVPEITTSCWNILKAKPENQMCATERMIVKKKGDSKATVLPCTLLTYDKQFELGSTLEYSFEKIYLNHPFCSMFCILGGSSCSSTV